MYNKWSKQLSLGATALSMLTLAAYANASMVIDLRYDSHQNSGITLTNNKTATAHDGNVVLIDVYAQVFPPSGTANTTTGVDLVAGAYMSSQVGSTTLLPGNLAASAITGYAASVGAGVSPFDSYGTQAGASADLNSDGNIDMGSTTVGSNATAIRAGYIVAPGTAITGGAEFLIGRLQFTVGAAPVGSQVNINYYQPTVNPHLALIWEEDNSPLNGGNATVLSGSALSLTTVNTPEPAGLGLVLAGTVALLNRRR